MILVKVNFLSQSQIYCFVNRQKKLYIYLYFLNIYLKFSEYFRKGTNPYFHDLFLKLCFYFNCLFGQESSASTSQPGSRTTSSSPSRLLPHHHLLGFFLIITFQASSSSSPSRLPPPHHLLGFLLLLTFQASSSSSPHHKILQLP